MQCVDVAARLAAAILRRNPASVIVPFDDPTHEARLDLQDTILSLAERIQLSWSLTSTQPASLHSHIPWLASGSASFVPPLAAPQRPKTRSLLAKKLSPFRRVRCDACPAED